MSAINALVDIGGRKQTPQAIEKHYSVEEVANLWSLSKDSVRRIFRDEPGVITVNIGPVKHRTIRIPESVIRRVHLSRSNA